jgi:hypothetical protein
MDWRGFAKRLILRDGIVGEVETGLIKKGMLEDYLVDPDELVFLLEIRHEAKEVHPDFAELVNHALGLRVLRDKKIDAEEVKWLYRLVYEDKVIYQEEYDLLVDLEKRADLVCPEYYTLLKEAKEQLIKLKRAKK